MKSNAELKNNVLRALKSNEFLFDECIGVCANNGLIILSGTVDNYIKKIEAVDSIQGIEGVNSVIDNIEVQYGCLPKISDAEIAIIVLNTINWNWEVPPQKVTVRVQNGQVTLAGEVQWNFQKEVAEEIIINIAGVRSVINNIHIIGNVPDRIVSNPEKRLHKEGNKIYLLDAAGRLFRKSSEPKIDFNFMLFHGSGLN